ncbi:hypothetical protein J1605_012909 [Eschrichtius robustus]|uniref:Uncharacterized protein n=1 Tax=Eschrichtius robustus TaxID=9764 RepID=A0AB34GGH3_ESCRO|nr:hypothetical protein J1605_012909 [Eschrichtius robustus]
MSTVSYGQSQAGEVDSNPSTTEKRPRVSFRGHQDKTCVCVFIPIFWLLYFKFANPVPFPQEAAAEEASLVSGEQYPGGLVPIDFGEATAGGEDLDEDMTCEMILAMMEK